MLDNSDDDFHDAFRKFLSVAKNLKSLTIQSINCEDNILFSIINESCIMLDALTLDYSVDHTSNLDISFPPSITKLKLGNFNIPLDNTKPLLNWLSLTELSVWGYRISPHILSEPFLTPCNITSLEIVGLDVTDIDFHKVFACMPRLRYLNCSSLMNACSILPSILTASNLLIEKLYYFNNNARIRQLFQEKEDQNVTDFLDAISSSQIPSLKHFVFSGDEKPYSKTILTNEGLCIWLENAGYDLKIWGYYWDEFEQDALEFEGMYDSSGFGSDSDMENEFMDDMMADEMADYFDDDYTDD